MRVLNFLPRLFMAALLVTIGNSAHASFTYRVTTTFNIGGGTVLQFDVSFLTDDGSVTSASLLPGPGSVTNVLFGSVAPSGAATLSSFSAVLPDTLTNFELSASFAAFGLTCVNPSYTSMFCSAPTGLAFTASGSQQAIQQIGQSSVPTPGTFALLFAGALGLWWAARPRSPRAV